MERTRGSTRAAAGVAVAIVVALSAVACGTAATSTSTSPGAGAGSSGVTASGKVGVDFPLLTSPFWQAYEQYVGRAAASQGLSILPPVNSNGDPAQQITDIGSLLNQGVKGLVVAPLDSAAITAGLHQAQRKGVPVVAVDVAPDSGKVAMVVRADNKAYGIQACDYLGKRVRSGEVVQIQGDLASVNGRDRSSAFDSCVKSRYPKVKVLEIPAKWDSATAAAGLAAVLNAHPHIRGIYLQAGGVYLGPTLETLKTKGLLKPSGTAGHITIVSNDGIPQEFQAIRSGQIDATVSQPADLYAKYGVFYIKAAMAGKTFAPGPTDHHSTIVRLPGGILEDQLPAPLVTRSNVGDPALWGNMPTSR